jgi:3-hydroxyisobutyrate dehydrogenase-like beta-hydroxyacid dehydrogenase
MRVHVVGAGKMGLPMARNLRRGGHALSVSDTDPDRLRLAREADLQVMDAAPGIAAADVILSSLPHDAALLAVGDQVTRHARRNAIYIDTSTVSQQASAEIGKRCAQVGVRHLRATVSGNNHMAEAARLTVMTSGPRDAFETVLPLLQLLGPSQFWLGEGEQARLMKLVVNLMIAQTSAMLAEALALGSKGGLDWKDMFAVLTASAVGSPILKAKAVQLAERDFTPTFTVEQMMKDLGLILEAGAAAHVPLPQTSATLQLMHAAVAQGFGQEDYAAIIKAVEQASGLGEQAK